MSLQVRAIIPDEIAELAQAVSEQPLLIHYAVDGARLGTLLRTAARGPDIVLVAEMEGRAIGFAWFQATGTFGGSGYLRLIALRPGTEGRGAGGLLCDAMEAEVGKSSRNLFLLVSDFNEGARRFYAARGYSEVGRLPRFVRDDTDELIYWKRI